MSGGSRPTEPGVLMGRTTAPGGVRFQQGAARCDEVVLHGRLAEERADRRLARSAPTRPTLERWRRLHSDGQQQGLLANRSRPARRRHRPAAAAIPGATLHLGRSGDGTGWSHAGPSHRRRCSLSHALRAPGCCCHVGSGRTPRPGAVPGPVTRRDGRRRRDDVDLGVPRRSL